MPDFAANSVPASSPLETPTIAAASGAQFSAPPPLHHASAIGDSTPSASLPPTVTPATTTRQSVSLGVLSTLWGSNPNPVVGPQSSAQDPTVPSIVTHAPSPAAQDPSVDLAASTSSVPSTTTTLTNTLPPTQSAALRALNAPAFQSHASSSSKSKPAKSTSSRTTLSSQPVVVRTYSGSRHNSRPSSGLNSPRLFPHMNGHTSQAPSALSAGLASSNGRMPSVDDFSFSAILRAVDPEIRDAIDAIAEICARSRLSLANEYDAHLPPQGEITSTGPGWGVGMGSMPGRGRISRIGQGWSATENTLTAVPEASSSSERLAGESRGSITGGSSKKRSQSAYGSLKSVISGGSGKRRAVEPEPGPSKPSHHDDPLSHGPQWAIQPPSSSADHPAITIVTSPQTSNQLSFDLSSTIADILEAADAEHEQPTASNTAPSSHALGHRRQLSATSLPQPRTRSSPLSSLASWIPWHRSVEQEPMSQELARAEARLREMLVSSQNSAMGKGKAPVTVA